MLGYCFHYVLMSYLICPMMRTDPALVYGESRTDEILDDALLSRCL